MLPRFHPLMAKGPVQEPKRTLLPQPLTFGGVAAFGGASFGRLLMFELAVAIIAAGCIAIAFESAWVPVINRAITALPTQGTIVHGSLRWTNSVPLSISGSRLLWINFDPVDSLESGEGADLQVEFGKSELRLRSILGYAAVPYPEGVVIGLNRPEVEPWWGAWHPAVVAGICTATVVFLLAAWAILGLIYQVPIRIISFYADRRLSWSGGWRVGMGCLLPGALVFSFGVLAYAWGNINLVQLFLVAVLHLAVGWIYVLCVPIWLPRKSEAVPLRHNPFGKRASQETKGADGDEPKPANPFADPGPPNDE